MSKVITAGALCTGCGACENICPKSCVIRIKEDAGFQMALILFVPISGFIVFSYDFYASR